MNLFGVQQRRHQRFAQIDEHHFLAECGQHSVGTGEDLGAEKGYQTINRGGGQGEISDAPLADDPGRHQ